MSSIADLTTPDTLNLEPPLLAMSRSVPARLTATLVANVVRSIIALASALVVARGLGASQYGDLNFLLGSFAAVAQLTDMGTSTAFYTFLSRRKRGRRFLALYMSWMLAQFVVPLFVIVLILPESVIRSAWVGHARGVVILAFAANFFMAQAWGAVTQLGEASRRTVLVQFAGTIPVLAHLIIVASIVHWSTLSTSTVLWLTIVEYAVVSIVLVPRLLRDNIETSNNTEGARATIAAFAEFCRPLLIYLWIGFAYNFADRWLLQFFGGAVQQGYFAVGQQFAAVSLLATTSVLRVFWKEVAEARELNDVARARRLYETATHGLFFVAAWISCLLIPFSREILSWTVGPGYEAGSIVLACLLVYPIYQTLGQLQGTFFFATSDTRTYARIGIVMMLVSLPLGYVLLAPRTARFPGLNLGAFGLALKMVLVQVVSINIQSYLIGRNNRWRTAQGFQVVVLVTLGALAFLSKLAASSLLGAVGARSPALVLGLSALAYIPGSVLLIYFMPSTIGLGRDEMRTYLALGRRRLGLVE